MALSHVHITGQTGVGPFSFSDTITLFPEHVSRPADQIRVFVKNLAAVVTELFPKGREDSSGNFQWQFDSTATPTEIILETANALITGDELIILRETRMDKAVASIILTGGSRFRRTADLNHRGDQILFVAQELRELRTVADILGSGVGDPFEYAAGILDTSEFTANFTGDGVEDVFSYQTIEMLPKAAVRHHNQLTVTVDGTPVTFTADENTLKITITGGAPASDTAIVIQRITRIDKRWVQHIDASTFSSLLMDWDFLNVKFIIEETQDFPTFLVTTNPLEQRLFARRINTISYSGPGDRFFFGNLPWFGDGIVFVFKDEIPLIEFVDYTIDFLNWLITLFTDLLSTETLRINTSNPFHAFNSLPFVNPNPVITPEVLTEVTAEGEFIVVSKFADNADVLQDHTKREIGEATSPAPADAEGGVLLIRSGSLGNNFAGSTVLSATITIENVQSNDLTAIGQFDAMDETFVGKTTYGALDAQFVFVANFPALTAGTGTQILDATRLFQGIADLDTINEAFLVGHEEPFPVDAASGLAVLGQIIKFQVCYTTIDPIPVETGATEHAPCRQWSSVLGFGASDDNWVNSPLTSLTDTKSGGTQRNRDSSVISWDLTNVPTTILEAHIKFASIRWTHVDGAAGTPAKTLRIRRVTQLTIDHQKTSWDNRLNTPVTPWVGSIGTGEPNQTGGATDALDNDAASELTMAPPATLFDNTRTENNRILFNLKELINAARAANQTKLTLVMYFDPINTPSETGSTQADLDFPSNNDITLVVTGT